VTGKRLNVGDFGSSAPLPALSIDDVTVSESNAGTKEATFTVSLSAASGSVVSVNFATADATATAARIQRSNTTTISIPSAGIASPYPSMIDVEAGLGTVTRVAASLVGFDHTWPSDVDVLLVGPTGRSVMLMSDVGGDRDARNLTLMFDDGGAALGGDVAQGAMLRSGTYRPSNIDTTSDAFAGPAPAGPYGSTLATFAGTDPAGTWRLFVRDDTGGDAGNLLGGWSITLETTTGDYIGRSGTLTFPIGATSQPLSVTVNGDVEPESSESLAIVLSHATGATIADARGVATIIDNDSPGALGSVIRAVDVTNLRSAIDAKRSARGLAPFPFTDPSLTPQVAIIRAFHIAELRTAVDEMYRAAGLQSPVYTDPTLTPGVTIVKAAHIREIQAALANLP
jgi:subtilisin-like proprotein convertase family protein